MRKCFAGFLTLFVFAAYFLNAEQPNRNCYLEEYNYGSGTARVLFLAGDPYAIGFAHGSLLSDQIGLNVKSIIDQYLSNPPFPSQIQKFLDAVPQIVAHIPDAYIQEMQGIADGAGFSYEKILLLNLFPELFHCSAITVKGKATAQGELYHVRVLDYAAAANLQETAVVSVVYPDRGSAFVNVGYAGFIGSVTGININKISIGEIGGKGYGLWDGMPMSILLRHILQNAANFEQVDQILKSTPRTCEYYYIFADGKSGDSMAVYATPSQLQFIFPGSSYAWAVDADQKQGSASVNQQPEDTLLLTAPESYDTLAKRVRDDFGKIGIPELQQIIKAPVALPCNLHNALFMPSTLEMWMANAGSNYEPAADQKYLHYDLTYMFNEWKLKPF